MHKVFADLHTRLPSPLVHHIAGYASDHRTRWQRVLHELHAFATVIDGDARCACCGHECVYAMIVEDPDLHEHTCAFCHSFCKAQFVADRAAERCENRLPKHSNPYYS